MGRGYVQLTWEENYRNASAALGLIDDRDLVDFPDLALDSLIGARILFRGCAEGWFTGAKLGQFFNSEEDNAYDARTIINVHDKASEIAAIYEQFLQAIKEAGGSDPNVPAESGIVTVSIDDLPDGWDVRLVVDGKQV